MAKAETHLPRGFDKGTKTKHGPSGDLPATKRGRPKQGKLFETPDGQGTNRVDPRDRAFHDWYRFVLSYPPHLVRQYVRDFGLGTQDTVLDPFCGTGTTVVESRVMGLSAIGIEANRFAHFASSVKVDWDVDPESLALAARQIAENARASLLKDGIDDDSLMTETPSLPDLRKLDEEQQKLILTNSISALPLHKALVLLEGIRVHQGQRYYSHLLLALANTVVFKASNLHFGPEVGVGKAKTDAPVVSTWLAEVNAMVSDLRGVQGGPRPDATIHLADARRVAAILAPESVDAVITSPPYPNEKDYTRTTRLESVLLGFVSTRAELREMKKTLVRSNTRGVYKGDDDSRWVAGHPGIQRIAEAIERRRLELGKTSGFERLYPTVTRLYFGGMARHLAELRPALRRGASLAYVVGDQASYLRVMIRTGTLLAEIAQALGYEVVRIDLFRTRFSTATREQLREEVVVLRWNGPQKGKA